MNGMTFLVKIVTHSCAMNQGEERFFRKIMKKWTSYNQNVTACGKL